ncbi:putative Kinase family protein with leucine-rich repeat domain [Hibiscus syriacus]|uniref:Kinase family protein with leucine-rich repeat domain n=1 Tax=Hibiscus syriacus TaxID=106335 RepID=A0A6A3CKR3_HIBSY|nr:uncharacterized protein LOC120199024 [Hibiscus syriacus]KAE8727848.1 putative Kinase family protein with leucine-rich repeat domain [Hibiscus syriacus]
MDREQEEIQFLGVFGIFKESYNIIFSRRKIFTQITLALILPLSFIYFLHAHVSILFSKKFNTANYDKPSDLISHEWLYFWLFNVVYVTLSFIYSLLSTAAVVYTIACIYTGREVSFKKVKSVVPKVWKRLMVTFLCIFVAMFFYLVVSVVVFLIWAVSVGGIQTVGIAVLAILVILFIVGLLYLTTVWHLASTISVLEEVYGFPAMVKSQKLIKGKLLLAISVFVIIGLASGFISQIAFKGLVVEGTSIGMFSRVVYAIICLLLLSTTILFGLVIQTVIYFVCKSYHHENIDKSALSDHLEVYLLGEYTRLKTEDVQLFHV